MNTFDVWLRPSAHRTCRVRVDGKENANWLLARLSMVYVTKTNDPIQQEADSPFYTFDVLYPQQFTHYMFEELLEAIPPVSLQMGFGMTPTHNDNSPASGKTNG